MKTAIISISGVHKFEKLNLITQSTGRYRHFDTLKCLKCGLTGRTINLIEIKVPAGKKAINCNGVFEAIEKIRITKVTAFGEAFSNLTPGSLHDVINPPFGYKNDIHGVWVMGKGEPVKVLNAEFTKP